MKRFFPSILAVSASLVATAWSLDGLACSLAEIPEKAGWVSRLEVTTALADDSASEVACRPNQSSSCGPDTRYEGVKKYAVVTAVITQEDLGPARKVEANKREYILKDASGATVVTSPSPSFTQEGKEICVKTEGGEVCAPAPSLAITTADREAHDESVDDDCPVLGCAVPRSSTSTPVSSLVVMGALSALVLGWKRRSMRH